MASERIEREAQGIADSIFDAGDRAGTTKCIASALERIVRECADAAYGSGEQTGIAAESRVLAAFGVEERSDG